MTPWHPIPVPLWVPSNTTKRFAWQAADSVPTNTESNYEPPAPSSAAQSGVCACVWLETYHSQFLLLISALSSSVSLVSVSSSPLLLPSTLLFCSPPPRSLFSSSHRCSFVVQFPSLHPPGSIITALLSFSFLLSFLPFHALFFLSSSPLMPFT